MRHSKRSNAMTNKHSACVHSGAGRGLSGILLAYLVSCFLCWGSLHAPPRFVVPFGRIRETGYATFGFPVGLFKRAAPSLTRIAFPMRKAAARSDAFEGFLDWTDGGHGRGVSALRRSNPSAVATRCDLGDRSLNPEWADSSMPIVNVDWPESNAYCEWISGHCPLKHSGSTRRGLEVPVPPTGIYMKTHGSATTPAQRAWTPPRLAPRIPRLFGAAIRESKHLS